MRRAAAGALIGLALGAASAAWALDISLGIGGMFASDFGAGIAGVASKTDTVTRSMTMPWVGGGVSAFLDFTYAEVSVGLTYNGGRDKTAKSDTSRVGNTKHTFTGLNLGLLLKYPVETNISFAGGSSYDMTLYAAAGGEYAMPLSGVSKYGSLEYEWGDGGTVQYGDNHYSYSQPTPPIDDFRAIWIKFGGGFDVGLTDMLFLRTEALYGFRLANKYEKDYVKRIVDADNKPEPYINSALGHGLTVKTCLGLKF